MFGRVAKIPIANTSSELVAMDFVDFGDRATFLHIQDTFSRFSVVISTAQKMEEQTAEMVEASAISERMAFFGGTPEIIRFVGKIPQGILYGVI